MNGFCCLDTGYPDIFRTPKFLSSHLIYPWYILEINIDCADIWILVMTGIIGICLNFHFLVSFRCILVHQSLAYFKLLFFLRRAFGFLLFPASPRRFKCPASHEPPYVEDIWNGLWIDEGFHSLFLWCRWFEKYF